MAWSFLEAFSIFPDKNQDIAGFLLVFRKNYLSLLKNVNELFSAISYLHTNVFMQVLAFHCFDRDSVQAKIF